MSAVAESMYSNMNASVEAGIKELYDTPDVSYVFNTNAGGGLMNLSQHNASANKLLKITDDVMQGHTPSSANELFSHLQKAAIDMYRPVTYKKTAQGHQTVIGAQEFNH